LHPHWLDILSYACDCSEFAEVCLQTNATLLSKHNSERLAALDENRLSIQVSLEGATAENNDLVRGAGSYRKIIQGLHNLLEVGLGGNIRLAFTEMHHNFHDLPLLLERAETMGIGRLVSGTIVCGGRAGHEGLFSKPTSGQYQSLLDRYHSDSRFRSLYQKRGNISAIEWCRWKSKPLEQVCSCIESPYITADGIMYPCTMLLSDDYAVAHAYERPLEDIICSALPLWSQLPEISRRRPLENQSCLHCPGRLHCQGGCMGRAYAAHGDLMSREDRCSLRQTVYNYKPQQNS
jgi:radical SAM protein with 4Fe4S-binding SPASM domain